MGAGFKRRLFIFVFRVIWRVRRGKRVIRMPDETTAARGSWCWYGGVSGFAWGVASARPGRWAALSYRTGGVRPGRCVFGVRAALVLGAESLFSGSLNIWRFLRIGIGVGALVFGRRSLAGALSKKGMAL